MKALLAFFYNHFEFLYLDVRYRITDSTSSGSAVADAALRITGPRMSVRVTNNRGQLECGLAPTKHDSPENWFRIAIVRQFIDGLDESNRMLVADNVAWLRDNLARIESMFDDTVVIETCKGISALETVMANKYFGPAQP
jgi:hypothetical protein